MNGPSKLIRLKGELTMTTTVFRRRLAAAALVASAIIIPAIALADENGGKTAQGERGGATTASLSLCDGGAQERVVTNIQNAPASTASSSFVVIPSTTIPGGASGDADTYTVTFSGEASATIGGNWEIQAQVSVNDGVFANMNPIGPNTFHTGNASQTHTMTWCNRFVASTNATFRVVWRKVGGGTAIIDDYVMRVERSN